MFCERNVFCNKYIIALNSGYACNRITLLASDSIIFGEAVQDYMNIQGIDNRPTVV